MRFLVYSDPPFFTAQCLDIDVASFGDTVDEAVANLREAVDLFLEDDPPAQLGLEFSK